MTPAAEAYPSLSPSATSTLVLKGHYSGIALDLDWGRFSSGVTEAVARGPYPTRLPNASSSPPL